MKTTNFALLIVALLLNCNGRRDQSPVDTSSPKDLLQETPSFTENNRQSIEDLDIKALISLIQSLKKSLSSNPDDEASREQLIAAQNRIKYLLATTPYTVDAPIGGTGGTFFNDSMELGPQPVVVSKIELRNQYGVVRGVSTNIQGLPLPLDHGDDGSTSQSSSYSLKSGEYFNKLVLHTGPADPSGRITYFSLSTNLNENVLVFGNEATASSQQKTYKAPEGSAIVGFIGRSGDDIDSLGPVFGFVL